ncbi:hypothetical protein [Chryseobacterium pennipullorum]|uniref:Uncharacterized protein n=1 Tax=Chryseobacterium pennipullorum TaxID=2258963 RepID=A0A3D9B3N0_9FLAO|nr:hypothetical protein [Chryseobacterium pennipullorum]REC48244.1 hypothetical protein DRF67_07870 [Chryseobacterium pennipullorum]
MKSILFGLLAVICTLLSCKSDEESLQRIDQIMNIYMKSDTNPDLLNSKKEGSYISYSVNDAFGTRDISPVTIPLRMTTDSLFYMEYIAGAKRIRSDSTGPDNPGTGNFYHSRMQLTLRKTVDSLVQETEGILEIQYRNTPTLFQVSKVLYDGKTVFSKNADAPNSINTVTIVK